MKDSLFELFLSLVEKTITQLQKKSTPENESNLDGQLKADTAPDLIPPRVIGVQIEQLKSPQNNSIRVFTQNEQVKLTKASHQFLVRMNSWGILSAETMELIINRLLFSSSRFVSLQETKWAIRNTLANGLTSEQLSFLELVLYQKEDNHTSH